MCLIIYLCAVTINITILINTDIQMHQSPTIHYKFNQDHTQPGLFSSGVQSSSHSGHFLIYNLVSSCPNCAINRLHEKEKSGVMAVLLAVHLAQIASGVKVFVGCTDRKFQRTRYPVVPCNLHSEIRKVSEMLLVFGSACQDLPVWNLTKLPPPHVLMQIKVACMY